MRESWSGPSTPHGSRAPRSSRACELLRRPRELQLRPVPPLLSLAAHGDLGKQMWRLGVGAPRLHLQPRQSLHRLDVLGVDLERGAVRGDGLVGASGLFKRERKIEAWI